MKTAFRAAFGMALVLVVIAAGVVSLSLGNIAKSEIEAAGSRALGAPVTLSSAVISPWSGRGTLRGLIVGNPEGFQGPRAFSVGSVEIAVRLSSLLTDTIVVESVVVREPELTWEIGADGSNLTRLRRNAAAAAAKLGGASTPDSARKGRSLSILDFTVVGGKIGLSAAGLGGRELSAPLPDAHLTNLGGPGRSPAEAAAQALSAIDDSAQGAVSNVGTKAINSALSALSALFDKGGK